MSLIDTLGATGAGAAPVVAAQWLRRGERLAIALGDGSAVLLDPSRPAAAVQRRCVLHPGGCLELVTDADDGWLVAGDDGSVLTWGPDARPVSLAAPQGQWAELLAVGRGSALRAWARGRRLQALVEGRLVETTLPAPATALAFDPGGAVLAAAHYHGVTLWRVAQGVERRLVAPGYPRALAWHPEGTYLMTGLQENGLHGWRMADGADIQMGGYPGQPLSLSFSADGRFLASSGGARAVCWRFDPPRGQPPLECGPAGTPVTRVAFHPFLPLLAAGHHNGAVVLCRPGAREVVPVSAPGHGAVSALAWSPDGRHLALGHGSGRYGCVMLPQAAAATRASGNDVHV